MAAAIHCLQAALLEGKYFWRTRWFLKTKRALFQSISLTDIVENVMQYRSTRQGREF